MGKLTSEELTAGAEYVLNSRFGNVEQDYFHLHFPPTFEGCDGEHDSVSFRYHTQDWMSNPNHVVHGGVIASLLDTAMGMTCSCFYRVLTPTLTMTINYAKPVPLNSDVVVRSRMTHMGGGSAQIMSEMYLTHDPDTVLASATGVYYTAHAKK